MRRKIGMVSGCGHEPGGGKGERRRREGKGRGE